MASWMIYMAAVGTLLWLAAACVERLAVSRRWPRRGVWAGAIGLVLAWSLVSTRIAPASRGADPRAATALTIVVGLEPATADSPVVASSRMTLDRALTTGWIALSTLCALHLLVATFALRRRRRPWRRERIDGVDVRLAPRDGPALVGLRRMEVVLPEWIATLDAPQRQMVLSHELEHRRARDPYLVVAAAIAVAAMPWNIALWLMSRRLRLAIEIDCDARVLRAHPSPERYGRLLLTVAQQRSLLFQPLLATRLSPSASHLERRISAMHASMQPSNSVTRRATYIASILATTLFAVACTLRTPPASPTAAPVAPSAAPSPASDRAALDAFMAKQGFANWTYVTAAPGNRAPRYPDALRASRTPGMVLAQFVVDTLGRVDSANPITILSSTNELFSASVREVLPAMRFVPSLVDGRKVKQLAQVPFEFRPADAVDAPVSADTAHRTVRCQAGACPVLRLGQVVVTAR